jgi:hypothetical protein
MAQKKQRKADPSQAGLAVLDAQRMLPDARFLFATATAATEPANLAYAAERLGVCGPGTPFPTAADLANQIESAGLAAMELTARDLKQLGVFCARSPSFDGVEYERLTHVLSGDQRLMYNLLADAWRVVLDNFEKALEVTAGRMKANGDVKVDGKARGAALSAFWSAHQRFFNQILCAMQMPSVLADVQKQLDGGRCCVLQLVNTNEAAQERTLAKLDEEDDLTDLDLTPRDQLLQLVDRCFPTVQYEAYNDGDAVRMRPVESAGGEIVHNAEALAMKERLLRDVASVRVPDGPLEMLINHFGYQNVAEVTGRKRRVVRTVVDGKEETVIQNRTPRACRAETEDFQAGRRRVLVFSDAGGTGASYHADKRAANQTRRVHYLIQPGWVADQAIQGFGRTHRTNQSCPPLYKLVSTDLKGQKRFISTIARRLEQLGALTKGQRDTANTGLFAAADNLESVYARDALRQFYRDLYDNVLAAQAEMTPGETMPVTVKAFEKQTGLKLVDDEGKLLDDLPPVTRFLNRLLSLRIDVQNFVFDAFDVRIQAKVRAAAEDGTLDQGVETIRADKVHKVIERVVHTDARSKAVTKHVELNLLFRSEPRQWDELFKVGRASFYRPVKWFARNLRSGVLYAFVDANARTESSGRVVERMRQVAPIHDYVIDLADAEDDETWQRVDVADAEPAWKAAVAAVPEFIEWRLHLLTGALLHLWDRLPQDQTKVNRVRVTEGESAGETLLGRVIPAESLRDTLLRLGVGAGDVGEAFPLDEVVKTVLAKTHKYRLANNWVLRGRRVKGEARIELEGPAAYLHRAELEGVGCYAEQGSDWITRWYVPEAALPALLAQRPVATAIRAG